MNLIDELDDNPTPAVGTPSDSKLESNQGEVTNDATVKQTQEADKYVSESLLSFLTGCSL